MRSMSDDRRRQAPSGCDLAINVTWSCPRPPHKSLPLCGLWADIGTYNRKRPDVSSESFWYPSMCQVSFLLTSYLILCSTVTLQVLLSFKLSSLYPTSNMESNQPSTTSRESGFRNPSHARPADPQALPAASLLLPASCCHRVRHEGSNRLSQVRYGALPQRPDRQREAGPLTKSLPEPEPEPGCCYVTKYSRSPQAK